MSTELLTKMFADRDTQSNEIPASADSESVVDENVEMDAEATHEEPAFMTDGGNEDQETDQYADQDNASQDEEEEAPEAQSEETAEEGRFESLEKQRADQQSYYQHQINELKMKLEAKDQVAPEPTKAAMTDDELNDLFWDNPAEAIRLSGQGKPQQNNINLQIQEGVQRAMHNDYDEVIAKVQQAASLNPQLGQEIWNSPDPAKAAYEKGTQLKQAQLITTDPAAYEAELRKKIEAEMNSSTTNNMPKRVGAARGSSPVHKNNETASEATQFQNMFSKTRR